MWAEIKTALNSTLGTVKFDTLDSMQKKMAYRSFYNSMLMLEKSARSLLERSGLEEVTTSTAYRNSPLVIPMNTDGIIDQEYLDIYINMAKQGVTPGAYSMERMIVLPPNAKEMVGVLEQYSRHIFFFPHGFKRFDSIIGAPNYSDETEKIYEFPSTIDYIKNDAFSKMGNHRKVIIHKKKGEIEGHPWGHPLGDDGILYTGGIS